MPMINFVAVLAAAVAGWLVGAVWYGVLGKVWMDAAGIVCPDGKRPMPVGPMILAFVAQLIIALMLAGLMGHMGPRDIPRGIVSGVLVWFGFVLTTLAVGNAFQCKKPMLTVIDSGHWLGVMLLMGAIIGAFGA